MLVSLYTATRRTVMHMFSSSIRQPLDTVAAHLQVYGNSVQRRCIVSQCCQADRPIQLALACAHRPELQVDHGLAIAVYLPPSVLHPERAHLFSIGFSVFMSCFRHGLWQ